MSRSSIDDALLQALKRSIGDSTNISVAYSGGLDSCVLLHLCCSYRKTQSALNLSAIHINHGLSKHAHSWQMHCQKVCEAWQIAFIATSVNIIRQSRTSLEQQARDARYHAIEKYVPSNNLVLLGQHLDDQAETFLLQLARGSGLDGLSAMPEEFVRRHSVSDVKHKFVRPLLGISQAQLIEYAQAHKLTWVEDESNADESFQRNFVRHSVMPVLKKKWPSITTTISRSAKLCAENAELVDEYMQSLAPNIIDDHGRLDVAGWQGLSRVSQIAMLRFWLKAQVSIMPSAAVLSEIIKMTHASEDAQPVCAWRENIVSRYQGKLIVRRDEKESVRTKAEYSSVVFDESNQFISSDLPYILQLVAHDKSYSGQLLIEHYHPSESNLSYTFGAMSKKCKLDAKRPSKPIKKWLQEMQVPPWERSRVPILMLGEKVIALGAKACCPILNPPASANADDSEQVKSQASSAPDYRLVLIERE